MEEEHEEGRHGDHCYLEVMYFIQGTINTSGWQLTTYSLRPNPDFHLLLHEPRMAFTFSKS
jgi:hypothetical protein